MKTFKASIDCITVNENGEMLNFKSVPIEIDGEDRSEALLTALDIGQAMSRSTNRMEDKRAIFFRVVGLEEV
jgi:hypothetical protein